MRKLYPISDPLTSVYVPYSFESRQISTQDNTLVIGEDYTYLFDSIGRQSIIKLNKIPYIDLHFYNHDRKLWYYVDEWGNRFSVFKDGDYRSYTDSSYTPGETDLKWNPFGIEFPFKAEGLDLDLNLYKYDNSIALWGSHGYNDSYSISQYSPISISVNSETLVDKTDYSGSSRVIPTLDEINPERNKQFYYDFNGSIYSNQDFGSFSPDDIVITYYVTIDRLNVKMRMNTNSISSSNQTPVVDYYILKLTGQTL